MSGVGVSDEPTGEALPCGCDLDRLGNAVLCPEHEAEVAPPVAGVSDEAVEAGTKALNPAVFDERVPSDTRDVVRATVRKVLEAAASVGDVEPASVTREQIEAVVLDEFAGQGGLGNLVLEQGAKSIADAVLTLMGGAG